MTSVIPVGIVAVLCAFAALHASAAQGQSAPAVQAAAVFPSPMMAFNQQGAPVRILYDMTVAVPENPQVVEARVVLDDTLGADVRRYVVRCAEEVRGPGRRRTTLVRESAAAASEPAVFRVRRDSQLTFSLAAVEYEDGSSWTPRSSPPTCTVVVKFRLFDRPTWYAASRIQTSEALRASCLVRL